jgi:hypothetical protein
MKLSELIKEAQEAMLEFGDIDVVTFENGAFVEAGIMAMSENPDASEMKFCVASDEFISGLDGAEGD